MGGQSRIWATALLVALTACGGSARVEGGEGAAGGATPNAGGGATSNGGAALAGAGNTAGAPPCLHDGAYYPAGSAHWICGCNTCGCASDGTIWSTRSACGPCTYAGTSYFEGARFPALDGCNTCTCAADGSISCTEAGCACDPSKEWHRYYLIADANGCAAADLGACPTNTQHFGTQCGCGCEQDSSCPRNIDCSPGALDCEAMKVKCPYSVLAL